MNKPDCERILTLAKEYSIIPICREIYADIITPITLLRKLSGISKRYYLLESVEGGEKWGRYSFLGFDPLMRVSCKEQMVTIERNGDITRIQTNNPLEVLREIQKDYKSPKMPDMPPFTGGFVGYFAYAIIGYTEPKLNIKRGDCNDFDLMLFDKVIAYDHLKQKICIVVNMRTDNVLKNYGRAMAELEVIAGIIRDTQPLPKLESEKNVQFTCNMSKQEYCSIVGRVKEYIRDGDIFQAVISRQFVTPYRGSLMNAYRVLRTTNPSPYMVYMNIDGDEIMSSSPETLVRLQNGRLTTFPVAGSRPRGRTEEEDKKLEQELLADEKELSEHNMLVDLGRNDLGKISEYSSVEVTEYMMIHRYSKIMHICSRVESNILPERDGYSAIEVVLPAGTLSGAPKIRACEIIEELEKEPRGIYGGALGYLDFTGNMDTCIAIRMAVKKDGKVYVQAGGGIVADSIPENEYEESANKALAVMNAIRNAGEVDD
ncbi:anthranilate synthase component I family protein [Desulfosporosinus sp. Sb-LF]|uniref:anthranilate synthase component I family protein n=1 Tax=Desulfosporosinus sp. Sb-LF TaxID=2560027 RepID=UPI00107EEB58|nr:anthranilate synthase component I family protein [Desulfosporosinus sp. Sb-LF]TGE31733.1 anthranilate synthase component I family protein [Desulfosporosinus sp. Sb-LF]